MRHFDIQKCFSHYVKRKDEWNNSAFSQKTFFPSYNLIYISVRIVIVFPLLNRESKITKFS